MLSDKNNIVSWVKNIVGPSNNQKQIHNIIININNQLSSYIRGKLIESAIVGMATYVVFLFFGMPYAELLSIATGISVVIPYVGIAIVAVPTILVAIAHFGMGTELYSMFAIYTLIQILDGNILVPILFSSAVKIHPIFIIMVIIVCGNIWGVWGVFFAIPIAILVKNVVFNWPKNKTPIKTS
jgi:putative permease